MTLTQKGPYAMSFRVYDITLELIRSLREPVTHICHNDREAAVQIVKAANSILGNLREGNRRRGRDRKHLFRVAAGSADEVMGHLLGAQAWGWVAMEQLTVPLDHADHIIAILCKLTR